MRRLIPLLLLALAGLNIPAWAWEDQLSTLEIEHISERVILVKTAAGYPSQMAINTGDGLVVVGTLYDLELTRKYRRAIEKEFGSDDFRYVICSSSRILDYGGIAAYPEATLIAHESVRNDMIARRGKLNEEIATEIRTFTVKADRSRSILGEDPPGPDANQNQYNWMLFCQDIADCLGRQDYEEKLPDEIFKQRQTLKLGDCPIELLDFGPGYHGNYTLIHVPSDGLLLASAFSPLHLAPLPGPSTNASSVELWLDVLDRLLEKDKNTITRVYCGVGGSMDIEDLQRRRSYIRDLWTAVTEATAQGLDFETAAANLSLDGEFSHIKSWPIYSNDGEEWVVWDHGIHLEAYWRWQHKCAAEAVEKSLTERGLDAARTKYREMRDDPDHSCYFQERRFNNLGYKLLSEGQVAEAIAVFNMNVETHPTSGNACDSLGEALLTDGQTDAAIRMYRKSLELDPGNENARRILEEQGASDGT